MFLVGVKAYCTVGIAQLILPLGSTTKEIYTGLTASSSLRKVIQHAPSQQNKFNAMDFIL